MNQRCLSQPTGCRHPSHGIAVPAILTMSLLVSAPLQAAAQDEDPSDMCDRVLAAEDLTGSYSLELSDLMMTMGGAPFYEHDGGTVSVTLSSLGSEVVLSGLPGPYGEVGLTFAGADEPDWRWSDDTELAAVTEEDMELVLDCEIERLPRLVGTFTGQTVDGYPMEHVMRLVVFTEGWIFGQWQWVAQTNRGAVTGTRSLSFMSQ